MVTGESPNEDLQVVEAWRSRLGFSWSSGPRGLGVGGF